MTAFSLYHSNVPRNIKTIPPKNPCTLYGSKYSPINNNLKQGCTSFPKLCETPQNFGCQKGDMMQVPYRGTKNLRCYHTKFSHLGDLVPRICATLIHNTVEPTGTAHN